MIDAYDAAHGTIPEDATAQQIEWAYEAVMARQIVSSIPYYCVSWSCPDAEPGFVSMGRISSLVCPTCRASMRLVVTV